MKKLLLGILLLSTTFAYSQRIESFDSGKYDPDKFVFANRIVFYEGDTIAHLVSIELAYDDNRIVSEVTFRLHNRNSYEAAIGLIKSMHARKPNWDVEVQIDY